MKKNVRLLKVDVKLWKNVGKLVKTDQKYENPVKNQQNLVKSLTKKQLKSAISRMQITKKKLKIM